MGDYSIQARVEAACAPTEVKRWLDSPEGIAGWWSDSVDGSAAGPGDEFHVRFPTTPVVFDLEVAANDDDHVEWRVPESPPWWKGTTITFELAGTDDGGTDLLFTHSGFEPDDPIIATITPAWVRFVDNLVAVAESGQSNPTVVN